MSLKPWQILRWFAVMLSLVGAPAVAAPLDDPNELVDVLDKKKEEKSAEEKSEEQKKAEAEAEKKRKELVARVIVVRPKETSTDYTSEAVHREVRSRTDRSEAMFFPEVDLYQNGRKLPDRTVVPALQQAVVPDTVIPEIMSVVEGVASIPWNGMRPTDWDIKARELRQISEKMWFVDRVNLREPLFLLYAQIGRAAENSNNNAAPNFEIVGGISVNYAWYLAALLAYQEPALMSKLTDPDLTGSIGGYLNQLQQGNFPSFKIDFDQEGYFDAETFNKDYEVLMNGIAVEVDADAQLDVFLGRTDVYLRRKDSGHGMSERLDVLKLEEKNFGLRDMARKKLGTDFIDQLLLSKGACYPKLDGDILNYLAIYQKLHPKAAVYVAVPENGNPNLTWIWIYNKEAARLEKVGDPDTFPVHFAFLFSSGLLYNWGSPKIDKEINEPTPRDIVDPGRLDAGLGSAVVPFDFEMRIHYNRLMINFGAEFGLNAGGNQFADYFQTPGEYDKRWEPGNLEPTDTAIVSLEDCEDGRCDVEHIYMNRRINRHLYFGPGIVLGPNAGIGFGPRFAAQVGWVNVPHSIQTTGHFGWAIQPPWPEASGRVRPMIDLDLRGGVAIARKRSLQMDYAEWGSLSDSEFRKEFDLSGDARNPYTKENRVEPVLGLNLGIGLTF
jgi:hypothetical protein